MRTRIFSLFLAIVMVVLAVPTLAIVSLAAEAGEGDKVVYSTSFSSDPNSKNFPTINLPTTVTEDDETTEYLDESKCYYGEYYYGDLGSWKWNEAKNVWEFKADWLSNAVTYNGNWEVGTIGVDWNPAGTEAPVANADSFYPYTDFYRASAGEVCITSKSKIWGTNDKTGSGGMWLNSARNSLVAGVGYTDNPNKEGDVANERIVTYYVGTTAIR